MTLRDILKKDWLIILGICTLALALRIKFLFLVQHDPSFLLPTFDSREFSYWAFQILDTNFLWSEPTNHTPLYAYFLAGIYKLLGSDLRWVSLAQYALSLYTTIMLYALTRRLQGRLAATIAGILMASYWFFIYIETFVFSEPLAMALNVTCLYILLFWKDQLRKYVLSGSVLGLSILCRPDIMIFSILLLPWLCGQKYPIVTLFKKYIAFILPIIILTMPVMTYNKLISGNFILRTQIGANLYAGNLSSIKGSNIYLEIGKIWADFISIPEQEMGSPTALPETQRNAIYTQKTFEIIKEHPLQWTRFITEKFFSILVGQDFLRSEDTYTFDTYVQKHPSSITSTRLIFVLAIIGFILGLKHWRRFLLLYLFIIAELFLVFFAFKTRYIMPAVPCFIFFAAYTFSTIYDVCMRRQWLATLGLIAAIITVSIASFANPLKITRPNAAEMHYEIAANFNRYGLPTLAEKHFLIAAGLNPKNSSIYLDLGAFYEEQGKYQKALIAIKHALDMEPDHPIIQKAYDQIQYRIETGRWPAFTPNTPSETMKKIDAYRTYFRYP